MGENRKAKVPGGTEIKEVKEGPYRERSTCWACQELPLNSASKVGLSKRHLKVPLAPLLQLGEHRVPCCLTPKCWRVQASPGGEWGESVLCPLVRVLGGEARTPVEEKKT